MRPTLFTIPLDFQIPLPGGTIPLFGFGVLLVVWLALGGWFLVRSIRRQGKDADVVSQLMILLAVAAAIVVAPKWFPRVPVYGYGAMLLAGFLVGGWFAAVRAKREGHDPELAWDVAMWVFIPGIAGARAFYIIQHADQFFAGKQGLQLITSIFNLPEGGLVLYGGVISGIFGYLAFCYRRKISPLVLADIITPSVFIGLMFGRLGCFMNGCCYGDFCTLPWAVTFPPEGAPFKVQEMAGMLPPGSTRSLPLHPAQLYSSLNGLVLAVLTWNYYPYRRRDGEVLLLGWLIYPITRFVLEIIRGDEPGQFGTVLTISQWVSLVLFSVALVYWYYLSRRPLRLEVRSHPGNPGGGMRLTASTAGAGTASESSPGR